MKKGFTLIEIMIVLFVFSVWILAVLKLIFFNISTIDSLKSKTTATLLAKEWLELVYTIRDSNKIAELPRNCIKNNAYDGQIETDVCKYHFLDNNGLRKVESKENERELSPLLENNKQLYIKENEHWSYYTHEETNNQSVFSRYILFTWVNIDTTTRETWSLLKIESHVLYQKWAKTGEVVLEWFIWNY